MKLYFVAVALIACSSQSVAVSFDCKKASTQVESLICSDPVLGRLDDALAANYKSMQAADFGGTVQSLKADQLKWLASRNKCKDRECILEAYRIRVDQTCEYGVVSGVHPICVSADDVLNPEPETSNTVQTQAKAKSDANIPTNEQVLAKYSKEIAKLDLPPNLLNSMIYLRAESGMEMMTLEAWLALAFESGKYIKISAAETIYGYGILFKRTGVITSGFIFKHDEGDLFVTHLVQGDDIYPLTTPEENLLASLAIVEVIKSR